MMKMTSFICREKMCVCVLNCVQFFVTPWTIACQAPLSMEFSSTNTRAGCHFLLQGNLPNPRIKPWSLTPPSVAGRFFTTAPPGKPMEKRNYSINGVRKKKMTRDMTT